MTKYTARTPSDVGCYGDGALGHDHIRDSLRKLVGEFRIECQTTEPDTLMMERDARDICERLDIEMSDDASEEIEAIDLLNTHACDDTCHFEMIDGDLMLVANE